MYLCAHQSQMRKVAILRMAVLFFEKNRQHLANWLLCGVLLLCGVTGMHAQSKKELEERRSRLLREIENTDKLLQKTTKTKTSTYDRYTAQQRKVERRERLIQTLTAEIAAAEDSVAQAEQSITGLNIEVGKLREEYARMARSAFRRRSLTNPLLYLLSAETLNQAFHRWLLLLKYDRYRKGQVEAMLQAQQSLKDKIATIHRNRADKEKLLASLSGQQGTLQADLVEQNALLESLSQDEARLREELQQKQKAYESLNSTIERIIQEEVRKQAIANAKKKLRNKKENVPPSTPPAKTTSPPLVESPSTPPSSGPSRPSENITLNKPAPPDPVPTPQEEETELDEVAMGFQRFQGRLPWPVENGFISRPFGRQKHPTIRSIEINNNGIDIRTEEGESVRAVFEGEVAGVQFINGHNYTVIIRHGSYYTVYSNIGSTTLSKGDMVKARQVIGSVSTNPITGMAELHFEVWRDKDRLNPTRWIED